MFEGIKIVIMLECVQAFVPKSWTNVRQSTLTSISLTKWVFTFWNYLLIENYSVATSNI